MPTPEQLTEIQRLMKENPVLPEVFLDRLGNHIAALTGFIYILRFFPKTEAERENELAKMQEVCKTAMEFLRECTK